MELASQRSDGGAAAFLGGRLRYGMEGKPETPLKEIAAKFEVSEATIRKYEARGIRILENLLKNSPEG